jgi:hypothetical protein
VDGKGPNSPTLLPQFNASQIQHLSGLVEIHKPTVKSIWSCKRPETANTTMKKNKIGRLVYKTQYLE